MIKKKKEQKDKEEKEAVEEQVVNEAAPSEEVKEVTISVKDFDALKAQAEELSASKEKLLRAMAEFENSKKRNEKQKEELNE